jgi:hypothetical protein
VGALDRGASTVMTMKQDRTSAEVIGGPSTGPVTGLNWSDTYSGGPADLAFSVQMDTVAQPRALSLGRLVQVLRGGLVMYEGILNKPSPTQTGFDVTAKGAGQWGDDYRDIWTTWTDINDALAQAKARGLRWKLGTYSNTPLYLVDQQESGSESMTERLSGVTRPGYYGWHVGLRNLLSIGPVPSAPTRLLFSSSPQARALVTVSALYAKYQISADNADSGAPASYGLALATNAASATRFGRVEQEWDISGAGTMSLSTAQAWAAAALSRYTGLSWAGSIPVAYGQYTDLTGVPVDLGCEHSGEVVRLFLADGPWDADSSPFPPITFPVAKWAFDEGSEGGAATPYNAIETDLGSLLESMAIWLPKPAVTS